VVGETEKEEGEKIRKSEKKEGEKKSS